MNNPVISCIVPVFKVEQFLQQCIDSILAQTFTDFELILVDDGSPDNSGKICDEYAKKDSRIKVIHKENGGVSSARNVGLDIAKGEWICFVDSDDLIEKNYLQKLHKAAAQSSTDIVISSIRQQNEDGSYKEIHPINNLDIAVNYTKVELISLINNHRLESCSTIILNPLWNKLYSANLLKGILFDTELKVCEDLKFNFEYLIKSRSFTFLPDVLYNYRCNTKSAMHSFSLKRLKSVIATIENNTKYSMKIGFSKKSTNQYNVVLMCNALYLILNSEIQKEINDDIKSEKKAILIDIHRKVKSVCCLSLFPQREALIMFIFKVFGIVPLRIMYIMKTKTRNFRCPH